MAAELNPYAAPAVDVETDRAVAVASVETPVFAVSMTKLVVLTLATFGLYEIYWMYRNWKLVKQATGEDIWPVPRAIFSVFFINRLLQSLRNFTTGTVAPVASVGALSGIYIFGTIACRIASKANADMVANILLVASTIPIFMMQSEVNGYIDSAYPTADRNSRFTAGNIVVVVVGTILWLAVLASPFLPKDS